MMKSQPPFQPAFQHRTTTGEATMQTETEMMREHQIVAGPLDYTQSVAGLSLTFDTDMNALTGDPVQLQASSSLTDLSSTVADPFRRTGMTPATAPARTPAPAFNCGMTGTGISRGNGLFQPRGYQGGPAMAAAVTASCCPPPYAMTPSCATSPGEVPGSARLPYPAAAPSDCNSFNPPTWSPQSVWLPQQHALAPNVPPQPNPRLKGRGGLHSGLPDGVRLPQRRGATQLWEFLLEMLNQEGNEAIMCWLDRAAREFRVLNPDELARRWGELKGRPRMNYDKLSRSLRYYYQKKLLSKVPTEKYVYRFLCPPAALYDALGGRDKRRNKKSAVDQDDQSWETTPSPANGSVTQGESDSELGDLTAQQLHCSPCGDCPISPQSQENRSPGVTALLEPIRRTPSQPKEVSSVTWRPPSPPSPKHMRDTNKQSMRHHPYLPRQSTCPGGFPLPGAQPSSYTRMHTVYITQQPEGMQFSPGLSMSLPADLYFPVEHEQNNTIYDEPYNPASPVSSAPGSPHSTISCQSVESNESETSLGLKEFVREFIEKDIDLPLWLDDSYQLPPFPVATIAASMPPFST